MMARSSMQAMIRTAPPQAEHVVDPEHPLEALRPSHRGAAFNWRSLLRICAPGMPPPLPRFAGVTRARYLLFGANTP